MRQTPIFLAACLSLLASAAAAQPDPDAARIHGFAQRMFATKSFDDKVTACFARTYDAAHLARHPKQTVSAMKMLVSAEMLEDDKDSSLNYAFKLNVKFRDRKGDYAGSMDCGYAYMSEVKREGVRVSCKEGCEGGGLEIALAPDSKAIIVKLDSIGLWLADNPQDESGQHALSAGADDKVFRLDRVDNALCESLSKRNDEVAALPAK